MLSVEVEDDYRPLPGCGEHVAVFVGRDGHSARLDVFELLDERRVMAQWTYHGRQTNYVLPAQRPAA